MNNNAPVGPKSISSPSSPCPGVTEIQPLTATLYGIRVRRNLISKLKGVPGLLHPNAKSDLFCVEIDPMDKSPEGALRCFKKIVSKAGLGSRFGIPDERAVAAR